MPSGDEGVPKILLFLAEGFEDLELESLIGQGAVREVRRYMAGME